MLCTVPRRTRPSRVIITAMATALLAASGCGSDSGTGPKYPDVAGTYAVTGTFDDLPTTTFAGSVTLIQADRDAGALTGSANLRFSGDVTGRVTGLSNATLTTAGDVVFFVGSTTGGATWRFEGTARNGSASGRHTLAGASSFSGPWGGVRQ